jgi:hypothetical protein
MKNPLFELSIDKLELYPEKEEAVYLKEKKLSKGEKKGE